MKITVASATKFPSIEAEILNAGIEKLIMGKRYLKSLILVEDEDNFKETIQFVK